MRRYMEVSVEVMADKTRWTGQAWWTIPDGPVAWDGFCHAVTRCLVEAVKGLGVGSDLRFTTDGNVYELEDDLARRIERMNEGKGLDDPRRVTWTVAALQTVDALRRGRGKRGDN